MKHTGLCQPPAHMRNAVICVTEQKRPNPNRYRGTGEGTARGGGGPTQRRVDDDVQAARFELVAEEKESVPVPLPGEPLESGQSITC